MSSEGTYPPPGAGGCDQAALDVSGNAAAYSVGLYAQDLSGRNGVPACDDRTRHV